MSMKSVKTLLIIEDNPGDARLLREMLRENGAYLAELVLAQTMSEAEECCPSILSTSFSWIWGCRTRKGWLRYAGRGRRRRTFRWSS